MVGLALPLPGALCGALDERAQAHRRGRPGAPSKASEIARGKRAWGEARLLWDTHSHVFRSTRVLALPVRQPDYAGQLWLVVVRQGKGREPWYLLTNEPVEQGQDAWELAISYVRRWQIEESYRFQKCELQIESIRVQGWEPRRKLLLLVTLAYGYGARICLAPRRSRSARAC